MKNLAVIMFAVLCMAACNDKETVPIKIYPNNQQGSTTLLWPENSHRTISILQGNGGYFITPPETLEVQYGEDIFDIDYSEEIISARIVDDNKIELECTLPGETTVLADEKFALKDQRGNEHLISFNTSFTGEFVLEDQRGEKLVLTVRLVYAVQGGGYIPD
jgi:hypothetical protein